MTQETLSTFTMFTNKSGTTSCGAGSSKLVIQTVEVKDRAGLVGEAPGLEPGMIVSAWNPDESWVQDALLRVNATKGVPTLDLTVWSLVDVMVHPLGVHIHQQVANSLWVRSLTCCVTTGQAKAVPRSIPAIAGPPNS